MSRYEPTRAHARRVARADVLPKSASLAVTAVRSYMIGVSALTNPAGGEGPICLKLPS